MGVVFDFLTKVKIFADKLSEICGDGGRGSKFYWKSRTKSFILQTRCSPQGGGTPPSDGHVSHSEGC